MDKAYDTARDNYSQKKFGKPLNALSIDELNQVIGAVPKRIAEQDRIIYEDVPREPGLFKAGFPGFHGIIR